MITVHLLNPNPMNESVLTFEKGTNYFMDDVGAIYVDDTNGKHLAMFPKTYVFYIVNTDTPVKREDIDLTPLHMKAAMNAAQRNHE